jgi:predicted membrane chloride channel (bestrophin family)
MSTRRDPFKLLKTGMHSAMGLMYLIIGVMVILYQWFIVDLDPIVSWVLGITVILYGVFRTYRAYNIYKDE